MVFGFEKAVNFCISNSAVCDLEITLYTDIILLLYES